MDDMEQNSYETDNMDQKNTTLNGAKKAVKSGISFGTCLAMVISFSTWHSVGWAIIHGLFSWAYVIYYVIKY